MPFDSIKDFRTRATEEDYKALETYIRSLQNKQDNFPNDNYKFSYSAAAAELRSHGYLTETRSKATTSYNDEDDDIIIRRPPADDEPEKEEVWKSHTICVQEETLARFERLAKTNKRYSKKELMDAVIRKGLRECGY